MNKTIITLGTPGLYTPFWNIRKAARCVLIDTKTKKFPILYVSKYDFHKIPGGGIDENEDIHEALQRECLEEVGCTVSLDGELGTTIEYKHEITTKQISYCYFGKVVHAGEPQFTQSEQNDGFMVVWMTLQDALQAFAGDHPIGWEAGYMHQRDFAVLREFQQMHY